MSTSPVRVLVVDDSAYIRKVITQILQSAPGIEVVGTAWNGAEALQKVSELKPDVITLDLYMPEMDGVEFLKAQMNLRSIPVVVCSVASEKEDLLIAAMEAGAIEFVQKPTALATEKVYNISEELVQKVITASSIPPERLPHLLEPQQTGITTQLPAIKAKGLIDVVVIGASTGGPQALRTILPQLPKDFSLPIAIVLHMPESYTGPFAKRLNELCALEVLEAAEGLEMKPGRVILAKAGSHLKFFRDSDGRILSHMNRLTDDSLHRPSVDVLFKSAADIYGSHTLGIVLTGMGSDGTHGAAWIKAQGGMVVTESETTCVVYGMPRSVVEAGLSDKISPLGELPKFILETI
ncbi:MAG: chemotaxis-specific protein-glutamate methyltransferase CheB [Omnitrophica WOR_2 bacterium]